VEGVAEQNVHRDLVGEVDPYAQIESPSSDLLRTILLVREVVVVRKGIGDPPHPALVSQPMQALMIWIATMNGNVNSMVQLSAKPN
jgi:hypothetical protein